MPSVRFRGQSLLEGQMLLLAVVSSVFACYNPPKLCPLFLLYKCMYVNSGDEVVKKTPTAMDPLLSLSYF